jgi:hypothetical protein
MRFLTRITIDNDAGNRFCRDKERDKKMETILGDIRPETVYFGIENGQRTMFAIVNVEGAHEFPRIAEACWMALEANVEFIPVMTKEDFAKASPAIDAAGKKYNWW